MASWEYFIYSKSGKYSPEDIAKTLISKGYEDGVSCKSTLKQNIALDSYNVFGSEIKENINIPEGKEGIMFSSEIENEDKIKHLFNIFQRRDIEAKLNYKFGDIDYKDYFEDAALEIDGKTYFAQLKSEKEMMGSSLIPGESYVSQEQFDEATRFNQRYNFYNCTFDDIKFTDNVAIGKLENCRFNRCTFENFDGVKMNLSYSVFSDCKILSSNFENAYFEGADIYHSEINNSNFKMANFSTASIRNTELRGNDLSSVLFYGATLNDVVMNDTVIQNPPQGLYLEDIYLDGATQQELEARQQEIFNELRIEPVSSVSVIEQAQRQLEPLPSLEPSAEADIQQQHLDKLQAIAEYEPIAEEQVFVPNKQTVIVNCFAGPGAGKTTCAWEIASELKKRGIEAEYVSEYAKELVWDNNTKLLDGSLQSQKELYDIQNHRVKRLLGKVDVVVTDSPAVMGLMYLKEENTEFEAKAISDFKSQHNFNLFINRGDSFQQAGRIHNLKESKAIDTLIQQLLENNNIYYGTYEHSTIDKVVKNIQTHLEKVNDNSFSNEQDNTLTNEHTQQQFEIISKYNPAPNSYQTWIRDAAEIKSFEETLKDSDFAGWETEGFDESYSARDAEFALKYGKITVYSSNPIK